MNSPEIKALIRKYSHLFWYIPEDKKEEIDHEILVEFILNYGDMDAVKDLFRTLGVKETARVFFNSVNKSSRRKQNYNELTLNFLAFIFQKMYSEILTKEQIEMLPWLKLFNRKFYLVGGGNYRFTYRSSTFC